MVPAFDLMPQSWLPEQQEHCLLVMEAGERYFSYLLYDRENDKIVGLKQYHNPETEDLPDETDWLEEVIAGDAALQHPVAEAVIIYNYPDSSLLPAGHFHIEINKPVTELIYGNARRGLVLSEKIHSWELYNVYRIPRGVHSLLQKHFSARKYWHRYSLMLERIDPDSRSAPAIKLAFYNDQFNMLLVREGKLQLLQTYSYEAPEDVSYYLLRLCSRFELDQDTVLVSLSGLVDLDSALYQEIQKYFLQVNAEKIPDTLVPELLQGRYPEHYFSPLLDLVPCV